MSGHEKHYIPHDDLLALIGTITNLQTAMETLDADIKIFNNTFLLPSTQESENFEYTLDGATNITEVLMNEILDASTNRYLQVLTIALTNPDGEIALQRDSDILIGVSDGTSVNYLTETLFKNQSQCMNLSDDNWYYYKTFDMKESLVPAGGKLGVLLIAGQIRDKTQINISILHSALANVE